MLAVEDRIKAAVLYGGRLTKRAHETRNGTLQFPGRSIRCSRPGPHHGVAWYIVHPAAPDAELPRSPDGKFGLSGSWDNTVRIWRLPDLPPAKKNP